MRKLLAFVMITGVMGVLVYACSVDYSLRKPVPVTATDGAKKTDTDTDKAALVKVREDAVAARHGGVLPKTMSEEDTKVAIQAASKWKAQQAAEKTKRELDAMKVKPPSSSGYAEIFVAKEAITKMMCDPDSAVFGDVFFVNDRKSATGHSDSCLTRRKIYNQRKRFL